MIALLIEKNRQIMLINDFLKRVSVAEILTIIFIFSVGISLIYKAGFYAELRIGWYLYTLSPQQLFLTSIKLVLFSMLGVALGVLMAFFIEKHTESIFIIFYLIFIGVVFGSFIGLRPLISGLYILLVSAILVMALIEINLKVTVEKSQKHSLYIPDKGSLLHKVGSLLHKVGRPIFSILLVIVLLWLVYFEGTKEANRISFVDTPKSIVDLKNNTDKWILIEMNGDKALIMRDSKKEEFKIVEYKEIESIKVN